MINNSQQGVSLYIAFMIMTVLMVIGFGMSAIVFSQMKMIKAMGNSVLSFYAADTGIERALYEISQGAEVGSHYEHSFENDSSYVADVIAPNADCSADNYCIKSVGTYKGIKRAIQATR